MNPLAMLSPSSISSLPLIKPRNTRLRNPKLCVSCSSPGPKPVSFSQISVLSSANLLCSAQSWFQLGIRNFLVFIPPMNSFLPSQIESNGTAERTEYKPSLLDGIFLGLFRNKMVKVGFSPTGEEELILQTGFHFLLNCML